MVNMVHLLSLHEIVHDGRERHRLMAGLGEVALPFSCIGTRTNFDNRIPVESSARGSDASNGVVVVNSSYGRRRYAL